MGTCARVVLVAVVAMLAGCAVAPTREAAAVRVVGSGMVAGCHLLGAVHGSSSLDGVEQSTGVKNAETEARGQASKWGANAIVWTHITQRYWGAELVDGDAYRCPANSVSSGS